MLENDMRIMRADDRFVVAVTQDNYGRWFVEAKHGDRKLAPIRCLTETEARDRAAQLAGVLRHLEAA